MQSSAGGKFTLYQLTSLYRKFSAAQIFTGHKLVDKHVLITDEAGTIVDLVADEGGGDDVLSFDGILCPGFINCHCHLELSHLEGRIPGNTGLVDFLWNVVKERSFDESAVLAAIARAENDMFQSGIAAVGDICNTPLTIPQKSKRKLYYQNFVEVVGFPPAAMPSRWHAGLELYNSFEKAFASNSIVPHAPYSVSPDLFREINNFPGNNLLSIHNQETDDENIFFRNGGGDFLRLYEKMKIDITFFKASGKTSLQSWLPYFTKDQSIILVHNVSLTKSDLQFADQSFPNLSLYYCLCPNANLYISNKLPDIKLLVENKCTVVLGTDSLASNAQLSITSEISTLLTHFPWLSLETVLGWATANGATALGIEKMYGSFGKGMQPGVVLLEQANSYGPFISKRII